MNFTRFHLSCVLVGWATLTLLLCVAIHRWSRIEIGTPPTADAGQWLIDAIDASVRGKETKAPPKSAQSYQATERLLVTAWYKGNPIASMLGTTDMPGTLAIATEKMRARPFMLRLANDLDYTVTISLGEGPVIRGLPWVSALNLVPRREGLVARFGEGIAHVLPDEMTIERRLDRGVFIRWIPDMSFGVDMDALESKLAKKIKTDRENLIANGSVRRFVAHTISKSTYPGDDVVTEHTLRQAAVDAAEFLLRHQKKNGSYMYLYDAHKGKAHKARYNLPRHAGTTYFLAQMDHLHHMPKARQGALRALAWLRAKRIRECGGPDSWCVGNGNRVEVGSAALTVVAASEILAREHDELAEELVVKVTAFLRSQQRADGELMHEFDLKNKKPIDIQRMYYSGESAFALFRAYKVLGDERNLVAATRLMKHLTGAGWKFLGSRYYYGEEHWTCIAAGEAREYVESSLAAEALDFCDRWAEFNEAMQYDDRQTPWRSEGGYGVGPFLVPRVAPVGSRTEAFVATYLLAQSRGAPTAHLKRLVEKGLSFLLRWRWAPGPGHLFADPAGAYGGVPGTPVDLDARNDMAQHAGSAWIRWADVLRSDKKRRELTSNKAPDMSLAGN